MLLCNGIQGADTKLTHKLVVVPNFVYRNIFACTLHQLLDADIVISYQEQPTVLSVAVW